MQTELVFGKHLCELTQIQRGAARLTGTAWTQISQRPPEAVACSTRATRIFQTKTENWEPRPFLPSTCGSVPLGSCFTPAAAPAIYIAEVLMCLIPQFLNPNEVAESNPGPLTQAVKQISVQ